jgi:hypothetical protein
MSIPTKELKALLQKSGNRCAFPDCGELLLHEGGETDEQVVLSKIAHIVAESRDGPRGNYPLSIDERNKENNLLLLCGKHHDIIDNTPQRYTVERLRQIKEDHETLIRNSTGAVISKENVSNSAQAEYLQETVFSTLFPVIKMPVYIYSAHTEFTEGQKNDIAKSIIRPNPPSIIYPYIIRSQNLYAFQDLGRADNPFSKIVDKKSRQSYPVRIWWDDPVMSKWFVDLLNRSLNKITGRKGLLWDKDHRRYYFEPDVPGKPKEVPYRPLNVSSTTKHVVWQPITKKTGKPKPYWLHRAVSLRFHKVTSTQWCLSVRPEFRVTKDGFTPIVSENIGSRVTSKKSRMFNYDLLGEINFWRYFLSEGDPRILLNFGSGSYMAISTTMMKTEVNWPGIPEKYAKPFKNVEYAEDLFSWAKLQELSIDPASEFGEYTEDELDDDEMTDSEDDEYDE